jgi:hypothetical protein
MDIVFEFPRELDDFVSVLLHQAPPLTPIGAAHHQHEKFSWINHDETFKRWKSETGACILHIHGSRVSVASSYIFEQLQAAEGDQGILYFSFKREDSRYNTLQAMLSTFIVQLVIRYYKRIETPIVQDYDLLVRFRGWTCEDLFSVWMNLVYRSGKTGATIIGDIDQCIEPQSWFLKKLVDTADSWDRPFKFVVTSTGDEKSIREALNSVLFINLDNSPRDNANSSSANGSSARRELADIADNNPLLSHRRALIRKILTQRGADEGSQRPVIDWLEASNGAPLIY